MLQLDKQKSGQSTKHQPDREFVNAVTRQSQT